MMKDLLLIGLDGAIPEHILKFTKNGICPNIRSLIEKGFFSKAFPSPPNQTATNWTTIATGAWTGTHGLSGFFIHLPGDPLSIEHQSQDTRLCNAEFLWDVAERSGKKCLLYNFHPSWPPTIKEGIIVIADIPPSNPMQIFEKRKNEELKIERRPRTIIPFFEDERIFRKSYPDDILDEMNRNVPLPNLTGELFNPTNLDPKEFVAEAEKMTQYHADCIKFLKIKYKRDFVIAHIHVLDILNHRFSNTIWPEWSKYTEKGAEEAWDVYSKIYSAVDNMIGRIIKECSNENTLNVIVSDHGNIPCSKRVIIHNSLQKVGLLATNLDHKTNIIINDLKKSKAVVKSGYIWVNLIGREPDGIVKPEEYEKIREQIIQALYSIKDPETGECPIALAGRKEDLEFLGQWGDRCGDVIFYMKPGYLQGMSHHLNVDVIPEPGRFSDHGGYLPNATLGPCSDMATLIIKGPGVKEGYIRTRPVNLVDVAPTIAQIIGMPSPSQSDGKIIGEALKIPNN